MNESAYEISVLESYINRTLDDTASPFLSKGTVFPYGDVRDHILAWLRDLEAHGVLCFLRDPYTATSDEILIEMKSYIGGRSSIPGFLNWE